MKAIETEFNGYLFRSRLEARWAVFLSKLSVEWSYESEGYDLKGTWYLPDFYVKDWNCWLEVKPTEASAEDFAKPESLAECSGKMVLVVCGDPWTDDDRNHYEVRLYEPGWTTADEKELRWGSSGWGFGQGRKCEEEIWLVNDDGQAFTLKAVPHDRDGKHPLSGNWASRIQAALLAARQAQFEHGVVPYK